MEREKQKEMILDFQRKGFLLNTKTKEKHLSLYKQAKKIKIKDFIKKIGLFTFLSLSMSYSVVQAFAADKLNVDNITYDLNSFYHKNPQNTNIVSKFFSKLPFEYSIKTRYGKGKDLLAIFIDANCPYCLEYDKKLEANQDQINATVYFFLVDLFDDPYKINDFIWCSSNREKNIKTWYQYRRDFSHLDKKQQFEGWKEKYNLKENKCNSPVKFNKAFLSSFFPIDGKIATPTTVFSNGMTTWSVEKPDNLQAGFKYVEQHPYEVEGFEYLNNKETLEKMMFFKDFYLKNLKQE